MAPYLGDYAEDATLDFMWDTNDSDGASITRATDGTVSVYKGNSTTQSTAGITDTEDFDGLTGIHHCRIDLSADAFYATGNDYAVVLSAATIDGQTVNAVLAMFSIENRFDEVDVTAISGDSTAADNLESYCDGTTPQPVNVTQVSGDSTAADNLESYCDGTTPQPVNVTQVSGDSTAADNLEADYDGTGYAKSNSTIGTATSVTNQVTADVTAISGDSTAADNLEADYDGTGYAKSNSTIGTATSVTNQVTADVTAISGDSTAADNLESYCDGTTPQPVNVTQVSGDSTAADNLEADYDGTGYNKSASTIGTATNITQIEGSDATDQINAACDTAIETYNLDHLLSAACPSNDITNAVVDNSVVALLAAIGGDISDYDDSTDSLEALGGLPSAATIVSTLMSYVMESGAPADAQTFLQWMRILLAYAAGEDPMSGDWAVKSLDGNTTRIQGTLSGGGRRLSVDVLDGT